MRYTGRSRSTTSTERPRWAAAERWGLSAPPLPRTPEEGSPRGVALGANRAPAEMIIDHSHRLHERVDGGRTDECPPAPLQVFAQRLGCGGDGDEIGERPRCLPPPRRERPHVGGQRTELLDHVDRSPSVVDRRADLALMADEAGVQQP